MVSHSTDNQRMTNLLAGSKLFSELNVDMLSQLASETTLRSFPQKAVIFEKGTPGNEMFAILNGRVKIAVTSPDGREAVFAILESGDFFGETSLLDGRPRSATCTAIEPCQMMVIERRAFVPYLERNPQVAIQLLAQLSVRLRLVNEQVEEIVFFPLSVRLARKLLSLADDHGDTVGNRVALQLEISQLELGNMVAASRESVNKQLAQWTRDGLVSANAGVIAIEDSVGLRRVARLS